LLSIGLLGEPVAVEGEGEPEADHGVGDEDAGEDEDAEAGEEEEAGVETGSDACEGAAGEGFEDEGEGQDGEGEGQARGRSVDAEKFEAGGDAPVEEGGLLEVANAVGVKGDPVVAEEHLAGDLGVDGVGVVEEGRREEGEAGVEEEPEGDEDEAIALDGGLVGGDVHAGRNVEISSWARESIVTLEEMAQARSVDEWISFIGCDRTKETAVVQVEGVKAKRSAEKVPHDTKSVPQRLKAALRTNTAASLKPCP
jgi:hypothetical protein